MNLGSWEVDLVLLIAIAVLAWLMQAMRRELHEQRLRFGDIRADLARLQERTDQNLREAHISREGVRRIEDYLLGKGKE
ncbi:MAG: hypothetical protein Q4A28_07955 [Brachymonas sp.]|nr:hypothetical protein [Brachymonas sp.]